MSAAACEDLLDVSDPGVLRLVSAGHPGPQLVCSSEARVLELPIGRVFGLGLPADDSYVETKVPWSPGDRLLVYTDGLNEAGSAVTALLAATAEIGHDTDYVVPRLGGGFGI